jgi:hypothetical protein
MALERSAVQRSFKSAREIFPAIALNTSVHRMIVTHYRLPLQRKDGILILKIIKIRMPGGCAGNF